MKFIVQLPPDHVRLVLGDAAKRVSLEKKGKATQISGKFKDLVQAMIALQRCYDLHEVVIL